MQNNESNLSPNEHLFPQTDLKTGYLTTINRVSISAKDKIKFLGLLKTYGNHTDSAVSLGYKYRDFEIHLKYDSRFREDYEATLLEMKHKLESIMYLNGLKQTNHKDRMAWLQKNFPKEYKPTADKSKNMAKIEVIDALYRDIEQLPESPEIPEEGEKSSND